MEGGVDAAIAFILLAAVAVALSVEMGRAIRRGETITAAAARAFILVLAFLVLALAAFSLLAAICIALAYLLRKCVISFTP